MPAGRPSTNTPEIAARICAEIALGRSLRSICKADDMPSLQTFYEWLPKHPEFAEQYARAKSDQADTLFDEILDIADEGSNDWMETHDPDNPGWRFNGEHFARSRLRVDARKWMAGKLRPKKYGERQSVELSGPEGARVRRRASGRNRREGAEISASVRESETSMKSVISHPHYAQT